MTLSGPVTQYARKEFSQSVKKAALIRSNGKCEGCGTDFTASNPPEADHDKEAWECGDDSLENCVMRGKKCCHRPKTTASHQRRSKADRQSHEGHWLKRGTKKKIPSRPFPKRHHPMTERTER